MKREERGRKKKKNLLTESFIRRRENCEMMFSSISDGSRLELDEVEAEAEAAETAAEVARRGHAVGPVGVDRKFRLVKIINRGCCMDVNCVPDT